MRLVKGIRSFRVLIDGSREIHLVQPLAID